MTRSSSNTFRTCIPPLSTSSQYQSRFLPSALYRCEKSFIRSLSARRLLAPRAVIGPATADDRAHDGAAAARAWLAGAVVDLELALHSSQAAACVDVVAAGGAAEADAFAEHEAQRLA